MGRYTFLFSTHMVGYLQLTFVFVIIIPQINKFLRVCTLNTFATSHLWKIACSVLCTITQITEFPAIQTVTKDRETHETKNDRTNSTKQCSYMGAGSCIAIPTFSITFNYHKTPSSFTNCKSITMFNTTTAKSLSLCHTTFISTF
jgi:hypothetical protein